MTYEERHYFSQLVGRILSWDECEEIAERIKELEEEIIDDDGEPYAEYIRGIKYIIADYM